MISNLDGDMTITGRAPEWVASYDPEQVSGPITFSAATQPLVNSVRCKFGDLDETLVLVDNARLFRKGNQAIVSNRGRLPFGSGVSFAHTHRYGEHTLRAVTDIRIPPGTLLKGDVEVDSIALPGSFRKWREVNQDGAISDWTDIDKEIVWTDHPLAILLLREDDVVLEIGAGFDLWRWSNGLIPDGGTARFSLSRTSQGVLFRRQVTVVADEAVPLEPRDFRFTWYLAWSQATKEPCEPSSRIRASWEPNGDLDAAALRDSLSDATSPVVVLDLAEVNWPSSLLHSNGQGPCFCSRGVSKRLRRIVRQLAEHLPSDVPIAFTGLRPAKCSTGRHAERNHAVDHWDLTGILEFASWARQRLGPDREMINLAPALGIPSLERLFSNSDHAMDAIEYEWAPPEEETDDGF